VDSEGGDLESGAESNQGVVGDDQGDNDGSDSKVEITSEGKEDMIDNLLDAEGAEPRLGKDIRKWHKLQEQIKSDLELAEKKNKPSRKITPLLVL